MVYIKDRCVQEKHDQVYSLLNRYIYNWHFILCLYYVSALGTVNSNQVKGSIYWDGEGGVGGAVSVKCEVQAQSFFLTFFSQ